MKWVGRCGECQAWGTVVEANATAGPATRATAASAPAVPLPEVSATASARRSTGVDEFDRVLGGGIVAGAAATDRALAAPVTAYLAVISAMVVSALGVGAFFAVAGALLFYASDAVLGWTRFVSDFPRSRVVVMTTYHLGQAGLVLALI